MSNVTNPFGVGERVRIVSDPLAVLDALEGTEDDSLTDEGKLGTVVQLNENLVAVRIDGQRGYHWMGWKCVRPLSVVEKLAELAPATPGESGVEEPKDGVT